MNEITVTLVTPDGPMDAFVARPDGTVREGIVVAQEAWGVNDHIRGVCRRFAGEGFVAVAPELYHRSGRGIAPPYGDFSLVQPYMAALSNAGIEEDVRVALAYLREEERVSPVRCGIVGFCMGGFVSFLAACRTDPAAAACFYGGGIVHPRPGIGFTPVLPEAERIKAPILLFFGEDDGSIPSDQREAIRARLSGLKKDFEIVSYPDAGHAFFCEARPSYRPGPAADSWKRTLDFFSRTLRSR
jgi:carboxymethylenebutenolidase